MIRVVHFVWSLDFGGIERLTLDLAQQQLNNSDLQCSILVGKGGGRMFRQLEDSGIPYSVANLQGGDDISKTAIYRVRNSFREFDIIHFHSFNVPAGFASIFSRKRIVYTEHGNFGFGRKATPADKVNQTLLKIFLNRYVSYVTFNSEFTREVARKKYVLSKVKQKVVYNGMHPNSSQPATDTMEALKGKFVVGTSSRFAGFKRIDRLINAFGRFAAGKNDVELVLVGDGPLKGEFEQLAKKNNIAGQTVFTGYADNPRAYQQAMNVCVFPSEKEPFGIAALETLSLGKPTLAMKDGGGILEILRDVEPADIAEDEGALAQRLEHYYLARGKEDPLLRKGWKWPAGLV
jgi:glycosyltransferase involved in cell wall biosynthesis